MLMEKSVLLLVLFMFLLAFCTPVFATDSADATAAILEVLPKWMPLLTAALLIGFGLAAVAFALSSVFRLNELGVWAKTEVSEMTASAFLAAIVLIVAGFSDLLFVAATGSTPMQISDSFLQSLIDKSFELFAQSTQITWMVGMLTGIPPQYALPVGVMQSTDNPTTATERYSQMFDKMQSSIKASGLVIPFLFLSLSMVTFQFYDYIGTNVFLGHFGLLQSIILGSAGLAIGLKVALGFVEQIALPVLVPLGIFLGALSITRKMGRTMIAIGICLYFFFPASVLMSKLMYEGAYHPGTDIPEISQPASYDELISFAKTQLGVQLANLAAGAVMMMPLATGPVPYTLLCFAEATLIAAPCTILFPVCYMAYLVPCVSFFKPMVIWPGLTFLNYIFYTAASTMARYATVAQYIPPDVTATIAVAAPVPGLSGMASFTASFYINKRMAELLSNVVLDYTPYVLQYAVPIILMPVIILLIMITAMRSISPAIGGDIQILGLSELI